MNNKLLLFYANIALIVITIIGLSWMLFLQFKIEQANDEMNQLIKSQERVIEVHEYQRIIHHTDSGRFVQPLVRVK